MHVTPTTWAIVNPVLCQASKRAPALLGTDLFPVIVRVFGSVKGRKRERVKMSHQQQQQPQSTQFDAKPTDTRAQQLLPGTKSDYSAHTQNSDIREQKVRPGSVRIVLEWGGGMSVKTRPVAVPWLWNRPGGLRYGEGTWADGRGDWGFQSRGAG